ncbi:MAG: hypothetical protein ACHQ1H_00200 [Nitrososphaerales archaeon]
MSTALDSENSPAQSPQYIFYEGKSSGRQNIVEKNPSFSIAGIVGFLCGIALSSLLSQNGDLTTRQTINPPSPEKLQNQTTFLTTRVEAPLLTSKEKDLLIWIGTSGTKVATKEMDLKIGYVYQRLHALRSKIKKCDTFDSEIEELKMKYPKLRRYLRINNDGE